MKSIFSSLSAILAMAIITLAGCKPEIKGELGPQYIAGDGIYGTWELSKLVQTDLTTPIPESKTFTDFFAVPDRKMVIRFNTDFTYDVLNPGLLPRLLKLNGKWSYNTSPFPTKILFSTGVATTNASFIENGQVINAQINDQRNLVIADIGNMVRSIDNHFSFSISRTNECGLKYVTYQLFFTRQSN